MATQSTATLMSYINQGGAYIMWPLVIMFGLGFAILLWRLTVILIALFNTRSLFKKVSAALEDKNNGLSKALTICEKTPGPVATIVHAGLSRTHRGFEQVEKAIESAGTIEMAFLENGLVWLATIANLAPMLGFFGTVAGMIMAFKSIAAAGDVEPTLVATGISVALITTAGGLLVAMPIQLGYNLCVYLIDRIIVSMEENSTKLLNRLMDLGYGSEIKSGSFGEKKNELA